MRSFLLALGFLTRFAPAMTASKEEMSRSCFWFPLVGLILGLSATLPSWVVYNAPNAWIPAWIYSLLLLWFTRALHLDGLADVTDAMGSGKTGDSFYAVLKDSRIGAFGTASIVIYLGGQIIFARSCFETGNIYALIFAPVFGRSLPLLFTIFAPPREGEGLGAIVRDAPAISARLFCLTCIFFAGPLLIGIKPLLFACLTTCVCLTFLVHIAKREQGYNGDFLGAAILSGELSILLACSIFI